MWTAFGVQRFHSCIPGQPHSDCGGSPNTSDLGAAVVISPSWSCV